MEGLFDLLKATGNNSMEKIINLFKEAKILDPLKTEMETNFRELFQDAPNPEDITIEKFNEVMTKFADDHQRTVEELTDLLATAGAGFIQLTEDVEDAIAQVAESITAEADALAQVAETIAEASDPKT